MFGQGGAGNTSLVCGATVMPIRRVRLCCTQHGGFIAGMPEVGWHAAPTSECVGWLLCVANWFAAL